MGDDDSTTYATNYNADSNEFGVQVGSGVQELYGMVDIPTGWVATAGMVYGSANRSTVWHYVDITNGDQTAYYTGTTNTELALSGSNLIGNSTNYVVIEINTTTNADVFYGGYVRIERKY